MKWSEGDSRRTVPKAGEFKGTSACEIKYVIDGIECLDRDKAVAHDKINTDRAEHGHGDEAAIYVKL